MTSTSHSEVDGYLRCRRNWFYGYGMNLERNQHSDALTRGKAGHAILEAFYKAILLGHTFDRAVREARSHYDNIKNNPGGVGDQFNVNGTAKGYTLEELVFGYYLPNEPYVSNGWTVLAVEKEFSLEYEPGKSMPMVIDLIARNPQGKIVIIDHKFTYDFYTERDMKIQPQIAKYMGALRALGLPADKGMYNMIRYRKSKDTSVSNVLQQAYLPLNDQRIVTSFEEQVAVANEIAGRKLLPLEAQSKLSFRTANKMVCNSCSFLDLCNTELIGSDTALEIHTNFKQKTRRQFTITQEIETDE